MLILSMRREQCMWAIPEVPVIAQVDFTKNKNVAYIEGDSIGRIGHRYNSVIGYNTLI